MLIDDIKKARINAMKARDRSGADSFAIVTNKYMNASIEAKAQGKELTDADVVSLINKAIKELEEERDMYLGAGDEEHKAKAQNCQHQIDVLKPFLPQLMSEEEIRKVIDSLPDKSIKNVMVTFKTSYAGKADMGLVSKIARTYQGK